MKITLNRINENFLFEGIGANNVSVSIDNKTEGVVQGAGPMELLLMAVGGCSGIDLINILKKQRQELTSCRIEVDGTRKKIKEANPFEAIHVIFFLEGTIAPEKATRAAALSFEKYCSVSLTLGNCVAISWEIILNGKEI
jgi:putative redox protein